MTEVRVVDGNDGGKELYIASGIRSVFLPLTVAQAEAIRQTIIEGEDAVTRVTVVPPGLQYASEWWDVSVRLDYQDNGRTLKIFMKDRSGLE